MFNSRIRLPKASIMNNLVWNPEIAANAQAEVKKHVEGHSPPT